MCEGNAHTKHCSRNVNSIFIPQMGDFPREGHISVACCCSCIYAHATILIAVATISKAFTSCYILQIIHHILLPCQHLFVILVYEFEISTKSTSMHRDSDWSLSVSDNSSFTFCTQVLPQKKPCRIPGNQLAQVCQHKYELVCTISY